MLRFLRIDLTNANQIYMGGATRANTERCTDISLRSRMRMVVVRKNFHSALYFIDIEI